MKAYYIQKEFLTIGKTTDDFNGVLLPVYDRERTLSRWQQNQKFLQCRRYFQLLLLKIFFYSSRHQLSAHKK